MRFGEATGSLLPPIALSDSQLHVVIASAETLDQADRGRYLERLAELLADAAIEDAAVCRATRLAALAARPSRACLLSENCWLLPQRFPNHFREAQSAKK